MRPSDLPGIGLHEDAPWSNEALSFTAAPSLTSRYLPDLFFVRSAIR